VQTVTRPSAALDYAAPRSPDWRSRQRAAFIYLAIALAATLFIAIVAVLYWRSLHNSAHTALLIIEGDANFDGAVVTVESAGGPAFSKTLGPDGRFNSRFILPPDIYVVKVRHQGRIIRQTPPTRIGDFQTGMLILKGTAVLPATSPAPPP
jgi:hypothetical protein